MNTFLFLLLAAIWGSNFMLMQQASWYFSSAAIGAGRVMGGALVLFLVCLLKGEAWRVPRKDVLSMLFIIVTGYWWPFMMMPFLVREYGGGFIGIFVAFVPLMTIVASVPLLGIHPSKRQVCGVLGGLVFLLLVMQDGHRRNMKLLHFAFAIAVPLGYGVAATYTKRRFSGMPPISLACIMLVASSALMVPFALLFGRPLVRVRDHVAFGLVWMGLLGVLGTGVAHMIFYRLLQAKGPLFVGMVTYLVPLGAILWGWAAHEQVTPLQIWALIGVLLMVALAQYEPKGQLRVRDPDR